MTKVEKRQVRREVQAKAMSSLGRDFRLCATNRQLKAACRKLTDQVMSIATREALNG